MPSKHIGVGVTCLTRVRCHELNTFHLLRAFHAKFESIFNECMVLEYLKNI